MVRHLFILALAVLLSPLAAGAAWAQDLRIVTYNVESDSDTTSVEVAKDIREIGSADIWALQEVDGFGSIFPIGSGVRDVRLPLKRTRFQHLDYWKGSKPSSEAVRRLRQALNFRDKEE